MSNYNSYEGALVSVTGVNYVLSCTTEEPDRAQVLLEGNLFIADLSYYKGSHPRCDCSFGIYSITRKQAS